MSDKPATEESSSQVGTPGARAGVKRPLVPVVLALMVGLAASAWGVHIPRIWLLGGLTGLLVILLAFWLYFLPPGNGRQPPGKNLDIDREKP